LCNDTPLDKSEILVNLCFPVQRSQNITWRNGKTWKKCFDHVHIFRIPCLFVIMNCKLLIDFIGTLKKASVIDWHCKNAYYTKRIHKMGLATQMERNRNAHRFRLDKLKESDHLEELSLDERAVCRKLAGLWTEFIYCSTGTRDGLLWTR